MANYDILGIESSHKIYRLNEKRFYTIEEVKKASMQVVFYHAIGPMTGRPWEKDNRHPYKKDFLKYLEMTPWKDREYIFDKPRSKMFKIQYVMHKFLPTFIYNPIHRMMNERFIKKETNL